MSVVAKMTVSSIEDLHAGAKRVKFYCVYDADPNSPNHKWSVATPSGNAELVITNPAAFDQFDSGKSYLVHFSEVE